MNNDKINDTLIEFGKNVTSNTNWIIGILFIIFVLGIIALIHFW